MTNFALMISAIVAATVVALEANPAALKSEFPPSPAMGSSSGSLTGPSPKSPFSDTSSNHQPKGQSCDQVSVLNDAVYCIKGPACSGRGAMPTAVRCPQAGATAVDGCTPSLRSFDGNWGLCVAPVSSVCRKLPKSDTWGCVWP
ncbi:hypothetical protein H257_18286 [Aphanomyces astaci]|uniref:Secreted protein n=1 Tax=Aphanomyces astaci TaxID=112090 RepID=W4FDK3_APHAT|nr:hypothetical protein H257_18286 [Aphanomyces astaci]ETV64921.1 hypothetical protein H257_18286 [Aphanomyces astaci]|eukprot:XP_009845618.1 hypothetical protein H257_18286 [Aphanomyces astaci]